MTAAANVVSERAPRVRPKLGLVLGSGLGPLAGEVEDQAEIAYGDLPGFPHSGVSGHSGTLVLGTLAGLGVAVLSGRVHYYESGDATAMLVPLQTLAAIGCETVLLTNAAGSLNRSVGPGRIMAVTDHINWSGLNPLIGTEGDARFVAMTEAYDPGLRAILAREADRAAIDLAEGVYMWFSGPSFETPAEIRAARILGADAVGMSTVPEVILARHLGLRVAALSLITNLGAGMADEHLSHAQTKDVAATGYQSFRCLVLGFCHALADRDQED